MLKSLMNGVALSAMVVRAPETGSGAITMADVAPYFVQYKAKYDEDCELSLDVIEQIMGDATNDDDMLAKMNAAQHSSDENDDRSRGVAEIDTSVGSPYSYAIKFDAPFEKDIETLAQAAIENKRGGAVIMLDLFRIFGADTVVNVWPVPGSEKGKVGDNVAFDKQETSITKADGTTGKGTASFYSDLVSLSARGAALLKDKATLKAQTGDVKAFKTNMSAIDTKINNFKSSLVRAVNLAQRMAFVNEKTGMECELVMEEGDNGMQVANSNKLIYIRNRDNHTKFDVITIGQFLALKVAEGKSYTDIVGTVTRAPKKGTGPETFEVDITTLDRFEIATAGYATFFDKINEGVKAKDMKAYNALLTKLNSAGSDDLLLSLNTIVNFAEALLSKPGLSKRLGDLLADGKTKEVKAA